MEQAAGLYLVSEISPMGRLKSGEFFNIRDFENLQEIDCSVRAWENSVLRNRTRKCRMAQDRRSVSLFVSEISPMERSESGGNF